MKRETRANLIFIVVLLALMTPGVTMTLIRRWKEPGRTLMPPPIREALAYIDRTAGPAKHMPRVVPPRLGSFVAQVTDRLIRMQSGLTSFVGDGKFAPVMSDDVMLQAVAAGAHDEKYRVALIAWSGDFVPVQKLFRFEGTRDGATVPGTMESYEQQNMPIELRTELQSYGYILPPDGFMWMIVAFDGTTPVDDVAMHYDGDGKRVNSSVSLRREERTLRAEATTVPAVAP